MSFEFDGEPIGCMPIIIIFLAGILLFVLLWSKSLTIPKEVPAPPTYSCSCKEYKQHQHCEVCGEMIDSHS